MALYRHVAHKDDLLDGMVELVYAEVDPATAAEWRATMRQRAISMRAALQRHPWAIGLMENRSPGPANLLYHHVGVACLRVAHPWCAARQVHGRCYVTHGHPARRHR